MMEPDQFEQSTLLTNPQDGEITPTRIPSDESNPTTSPSQEDDDLIQEVPPPPPPPPTTTTNTTSSNQNQDQRFSTSFVKFDPNQTLPIDHTRSFTNSEYRSLMTRRGSNTGSIMTEDCSSEDKAGSSNLSLYEDDAFGISSDDPLDSLEKAYPRKGPSRYIIESDNRFTLWSLRGWLNIGKKQNHISYPNIPLPPRNQRLSRSLRYDLSSPLSVPFRRRAFDPLGKHRSLCM